MKVLVCAQDYPDNEGCVSLMYVHTRSLYYLNAGINVTVLNFNAKSDYVKDGVKVICLQSYKEKTEAYDVLILHAANIRSHYVFLKKYGKNFPRFIFFYHGHEVMRINKDYAKPYPYVKKNFVKAVFQNVYDWLKLKIWRAYLKKNVEKTEFVFVSQWMYETFLKNVKIPESLIKGRSTITYNSVGESFERGVYDDKTEKKYDFVTIRSFLDGSKYAVDLVNSWAKKTPDCKFLLVGKGEFFEHYEKADNLEWRNQTMGHREIIDALQSARFALMPTRTDAQGLMMCEMAAFGIPVITSNIPVCHEVFEGFENAFFVENDASISLEQFAGMESKCIKHDRFFSAKTAKNEIEIINKVK